MCGCVVTDVSVDAQLTVKPSNTAALLGSKVVLQCATSGSSADMYWSYTPLSSTLVDIVTFCSVLTDYTSQYSVNKTETGRCDLVINEATLDMAGKYLCGEFGDQVNVQLTVIGESLVLIVCIQQFVSFPFHLLRSKFFSEDSIFISCIIPQFTSQLSRLCPSSPGFYVDCLFFGSIK